LAHGDVQDWFWDQGTKEPALYALRQKRQAIIYEPVDSLADAQQTISPEEAATKIMELSVESGAFIVGISQVDPLWVFEGYECDYPFVVLMGIAMDHDALSTAPEVTSAGEVVDKYTRGWMVSRPVANWLQSMGWRASAHAGPEAGPITMVPPALKSGFGELGKHGSIINCDYGSSFRLTAVFTDLPLIETEAVDIAAQDFCVNCKVSVNACPPEAIQHDTQNVRGVDKWYVDFDKCFPYFAETYGSGICIAVCPWSKSGRGPILSDKLLGKRLKYGGAVFLPIVRGSLCRSSLKSVLDTWCDGASHSEHF
jgi:Pyruvate/2-oxoacid:ferredoxin oxidoreductase delta subunit